MGSFSERYGKTFWPPLWPSSARLGALGENRLHKGPKVAGREEGRWGGISSNRDPEEGWRRRRTGGAADWNRHPSLQPRGYSLQELRLWRICGRSCSWRAAAWARAHARVGKPLAKVNPLQKESGGKSGEQAYTKHQLRHYITTGIVSAARQCHNRPRCCSCWQGNPGGISCKFSLLQSGCTHDRLGSECEIYPTPSWSHNWNASFKHQDWLDWGLGDPRVHEKMVQGI